MQRVLMDKLIEWKDNADRKPLLIDGIRHSGKTYLLKDFGARYFKDVVYIDFSEDKYIADLFGHNRDPQRILTDLSIFMERDIKLGETLIVFDEIQCCIDALESLKHFCDFSDECYIAAAGSYLNVTMPHGVTIPLDKVELFTLHTMGFYEFLLAQSPMLAMHLKVSAPSGEPYKTFKKQLEEKYRDYQVVGGMPEVVQSWIDTKSIETVNMLQTRIIKDFENDMASLAPSTMYPKLSAIWNAIPAQLIKGNKKFMFSKIRKSWRAKDLDDALYWLTRSGLAYKVEHIERPGIPMSSFANPSFFKLYMCDVGLMRRVGQFPLSMIIGGDNAVGIDLPDIKSAIAENVVCCELIRIYESDLFYWSAENPGKAEVDFIIQDGDLIIPIEVKPSNAGRARSLSQYCMKFNPKKSVVTGAGSAKEDILPLYAFWNLKEWLVRSAERKGLGDRG